MTPRRATRRRWSPATWATLIVAVLVVAFVAVAVTGAERSRSGRGSAVPLPPASSLHAGANVPLRFDLPRLGGGAAVDLQALIGHRPAVVNFFASWCPDCVSELGALGRAWRAEGSKVSFVGIDTNETDLGKARSLLERAGAGYPVGIDGTSDRVTAAWGLANGLPVTFFLDRRGRIAFEVLGEQSTAVLARRVAELATGTSVS